MRPLAADVAVVGLRTAGGDTGILVGEQADGALIVETDDGTKPVYSATVRLADA